MWWGRTEFKLSIGRPEEIVLEREMKRDNRLIISFISQVTFTETAPARWKSLDGVHPAIIVFI